MEIMGAKNFWVLPDGEIEEVGDHIGWFTDNVESEFFHDEDGFPIKQDGSIAEESDVYNAAYNLGYVRLVKQIGDYPLMFDYDRNRPPTPKQIKAIKDFAIENHWELRDNTMRKYIDLL